MKAPIIVLSGEAGSGKDTVAQFIADAQPGTVRIAFADPMKRFAMQVFGFTEQQLWGPSEERNKVVDTLGIEDWEELQAKLHRGSPILRMQVMEMVGDQHRQGWVLGFQDWLDLIKPKFEERAVSARYILQTLGTQFGRSLDRDIWVRRGWEIAAQLLGGGYAYERTSGLIEQKGSVVDLVVITDGRFRNELTYVRSRGASVIGIVRKDNTSDVEKAGVAGHQSEVEMKTIPWWYYDMRLLNDGTLEDLRHITRLTLDELLRKDFASYTASSVGMCSKTSSPVV